MKIDRHQTRSASEHRKTREGMTLIETCIGLLIFGICIAGMCSLLISVKEASDNARDHYVAINIAKNRIERAKTFGFDELPLFAENGTVVDGNGAANSEGRYRRTTTVATVLTNLVEISLVVDIRSRKTLAFGSENEVLRTYVADMQDSSE